MTGPAYASWLSDTHIVVTGSTSKSIAVLKVTDLIDPQGSSQEP